MSLAVGLHPSGMPVGASPARLGEAGRVGAAGARPIAIGKPFLCFLAGLALGLFGLAGDTGTATAACGAATSDACTLASLAPRLLLGIGVGNAPYAADISAISPVAPVEGDEVDEFTAPDGTPVRLVVQAPVARRAYRAPPIAAGQDAQAYFARQIAMAGNNAVLTLPRATYGFAASACAAPTGAHVALAGAHDLIVDGQGSTLNFAADCFGIALSGAQRVALRNFVLDWPGLNAAAVGTVMATDGRTFSLQLPPGGGPQRVSAVTAWDAARNQWSLTSTDEAYYAHAAAVPPTGLVAGLPTYGVPFRVGETLLARDLSGAGSAIAALASQDITLQNVRVVAAPKFALFVANVRGLHIDRMSVSRGHGNPISTQADAIHFASHGGDVLIENSVFAHQGDDGLNLHTAMQPVPPTPGCAAGADCPAAGMLAVALPDGTQAQDGDRIGLFDAGMRYLGSQPARCDAGACRVDGGALSGGGYLADLSKGGARFILRNNQFLHNRARGALLQTPYGLVANNLFYGQSLFALYCVASAYWQEGAGAQNVLVVGNTFSNPGRSGFAAVVVAREGADGVAHQAAGGPPLAGVHQSLVFAQNQFQGLPGAALAISSANAVAVDGNSFPVPRVAGGDARRGGAALADPASVTISDASNVALSNNTGAAGRVSVDPGTTVGVTY